MMSEGYAEIIRVIREDMPLAAGMETLIAFCAKHMPDFSYKSIQDLNFELDVEALYLWLEKVLKEEPFSENIKALWFGLYTAVLEEGDKPFCRLYVSGSTTTPEDDVDWAVWASDSYIPNGRYAVSQVLADIYSVTANTYAEYVLCLGYAAMAVKIICLRVLPKKIIAVGFDSGDQVLLGYL